MDSINLLVEEGRSSHPALDKKSIGSICFLNRLEPHMREGFYTCQVILVAGYSHALAVRALRAQILTWERQRRKRLQFAITSAGTNRARIAHCSGRISHIEALSIVNCGTKSNIPFFQQVFRESQLSYMVMLEKASDGSRQRACSAAQGSALDDQIWYEVVSAHQAGIPARRYTLEVDFEPAVNLTGNAQLPHTNLTKPSRCERVLVSA